MKQSETSKRIQGRRNFSAGIHNPESEISNPQSLRPYADDPNAIRAFKDAIVQEMLQELADADFRVVIFETFRGDRKTHYTCRAHNGKINFSETTTLGYRLALKEVRNMIRNHLTLLKQAQKELLKPKE